MNGQFRAIGQRLQRHLPQAISLTITPSAVDRDVELLGVRVAFLAHALPPTANTFGCECSRVMVGADTYPTFIMCEIVDAVRRCFVQGQRREIICLNRIWLPFRLPLLTAICELSDQFLFSRRLKSPVVWPLEKRSFFLQST